MLTSNTWGVVLRGGIRTGLVEGFIGERSGTITTNEVRARAWCPGNDWRIWGFLTLQVLQPILTPRVLCSITLVQGEIHRSKMLCFAQILPEKVIPSSRRVIPSASSQRCWISSSVRQVFPRDLHFQHHSSAEHPRAEKPEHIMQPLTLIRFKILKR